MESLNICFYLSKRVDLIYSIYFIKYEIIYFIIMLYFFNFIIYYFWYLFDIEVFYIQGNIDIYIYL